MTLPRVLGGVLVVALVALGAFIASNTYWDDMPYRTPPKGEAVTNPFYAAQRLVEALGGRARREQTLVLPSEQAVIVVSAWHWDLSAERQAALEQWVASGGRLVVDANLSGDRTRFESWSGVEEAFNEDAADRHDDEQTDHESEERCTDVEDAEPSQDAIYRICDLDFTYLSTKQPVQWALGNSVGYQAVRVGVGQGSVTVINNVPFTHQLLFDGDHARLFVAATQLHRGDEVIFLSEDDHPRLLALLWKTAAPAVVLSLVVLALVLWRGATRFGPLAPQADPPRRSMAEQIRGTGRFVLRYGDGEPLHAASVRALNEAARRRIPAYARLPRPQRATALARFTGLDGKAIVAAIEDASKRRPGELENTLGLLETARRQLLSAGD